MRIPRFGWLLIPLLTQFAGGQQFWLNDGSQISLDGRNYIGIISMNGRTAPSALGQGAEDACSSESNRLDRLTGELELLRETATAQKITQWHRQHDQEVKKLNDRIAIDCSPGLSGIWSGDDGSTYFLTQVGTTLWWAGLSNRDVREAGRLVEGGLQGIGLTSSSVFRGQVKGSGPWGLGGVHVAPVGASIEGTWANVPRGSTMSSGTLSASITGAGGGIQLKRTSSTGDLQTSTWSRAVGTVLGERDIHSVFDQVKKNQNAWRDHSLLDNLKPYKDSAVIFGTVVPDEYGLPWLVCYPPDKGRMYKDFICLNDNDSPPDGDLNFDISVDQTNLTTVVVHNNGVTRSGFWVNGWEPGINPNDFETKLSYNPGKRLHAELIAFGRTSECGEDSHYEDPPWLPGWQDLAGDSVLLKRAANQWAGEHRYPGTWWPRSGF